MYQVIFEEPAQRQLRKLDRSIQVRLLKALLKLEINPRMNGSKRLTGMEDLYRIRSGDYRILYRIKDDKLLILVVGVGHRREIYKRL